MILEAWKQDFLISRIAFGRFWVSLDTLKHAETCWFSYCFVRMWLLSCSVRVSGVDFENLNDFGSLETRFFRFSDCIWTVLGIVGDIKNMLKQAGFTVIS